MIIQVVIMIFPFAGILALCHSRMGTQCVQTPEQAVFTTARNINARGAGSSGKAIRGSLGYLNLGCQTMGKNDMRCTTAESRRGATHGHALKTGSADYHKEAGSSAPSP